MEMKIMMTMRVRMTRTSMIMTGGKKNAAKK